MAGDTEKKRSRGGGFAANPELAKEAGRKGGLKVREKYGADRYADIGRQGGEAVRDRYGSDYFRQIGRKGGKVSTKTTPDKNPSDKA
jgi:general stress protein YciG